MADFFDQMISAEAPIMFAKACESESRSYTPSPRAPTPVFPNTLLHPQEILR